MDGAGLRRVVVVGASLAGLGAVRALRADGFGGEVVVVGDEVHRPYDRPPLSKDFLLGTVTTADLALEGPADAGLAARWVLGTPATHLDAATRTVVLADGTELAADGVVVATGARARRLPGTDGVAGVHVLRTLDDATSLAADLTAGSGAPARRLVVVGGGLLGGEVAATARTLGLHVTVLDRAPAPFARLFGPDVGRHVQALHTAHGTTVRGGVHITGLRTTPGPDGRERVRAVRLADGEEMDADVVVAAIGALPATGWLAGSGLDVRDGVVTDDRGATGATHVVAVGDCATVADPATGTPVRDEHWTPAAERPAVAVRTLLSGGRSGQRFGRVPYHWSDVYSERLQFAGRRLPGDVAVVAEGTPGEGRFVVVWERAGVPTAVLAVSSARTFTRLRRDLLKRAAPG